MNRQSKIDPFTGAQVFADRVEDGVHEFRRVVAAVEVIYEVLSSLVERLRRH